MSSIPSDQLVPLLSSQVGLGDQPVQIDGIKPPVKTGSLNGVSVSQVSSNPGQAKAIKEGALHRIGRYFSTALKVITAPFALALGAVGMVSGLAAAFTTGVAGGVIGTIVGGFKGLVSGGVWKGMKEGFAKGAELGYGVSKAPFEIAGRLLCGIGDLTSFKCCQANPLDKLATVGVPDNSLFKEVVGAGTVGTVMSEYLEKTGSPVSKEDMERYVRSGERIVDAIKTNGLNSDGSVTVTVNGQQLNVKPDTETARAVSWYMMAKAAGTPAPDGKGQQFERGSMILKDPGHKIAKFLSGAPTCYGRISTHFAERSVSSTSFANRFCNGGFFSMFSKQPLQYGIEDFDGRMPGGQGCLLFDKLKNKGSEEIFLKWESAGTPTVMRFTSSHSDGFNPFTALGNQFRAVSRCLSHCSNFLVSKFESGSAEARREAVDKGPLKDLVWNRFTALIEGSGLPQDAQKAIIKQGHKEGLAFIESVAEGIDEFSELNSPEPQRLLTHLREGITRYRGTVGPDEGVARRGHEVHISV